MKIKSQIKSQRYTRRQLLNYMTKGVAGSLALPSLLPNALAQTITPNRKVLFVYCEAGATHRYMNMRPTWFNGGTDYLYRYYDLPNFSGTTPDNSSWSFNFTDSRLMQNEMSEVLAPLFPLRDKLTFLEGLAMTSTGEDRYGDSHARNHLGAMSGTPGASEKGVQSTASTPSVDQRINDFLKLSNPNHVSLNYRLNFGTDIFHEFLYYNADRTGGTNIQRLPVEIDPKAAFDRVFARLNTGGSANSNRDKIFQLLNGSYSSLANRLSAADKTRIENHRALLNELSSTMIGPATCGNLQRPTVDFFGSYDSNRQAHINAQAPMFSAFSQMVASGFSCGISRVASIGMAVLPPEIYGLPKGTDIHHEYEHPTDPYTYYNMLSQNAAGLSTYLAKENAMKDRNIWQVQQLKKLADIFAATPDTSGQGSLLDNTLIVYVNELSHGNHGGEHWPVILLGGFGGAITPGRYIKYPQNVPNPFQRNYNNEYTGVAHTKLFISIMQAMGMNIDALGTPALDGAVPHRGISVKNGVELRGPLDRLKV
jgi:hypothetical protein